MNSLHDWPELPDRYVPDPSIGNQEWPVDLDPAADYDAIGRKVPQRLGFMQFARAVPGYIDRFAREVPTSHYNAKDNHAVVTCPCGAEPLTCEVFAPCSCSCRRVYAWTGRSLRVAYTQ